MFSAAVLLAVTATSSYAGKCDRDDSCTEDLVILGNNGAILGSSVETFSAGSRSNNKPKTEIKGNKTGLASPAGVALSLDGQVIVVGNQLGGDVVKYGVGQTGNSSPLAVIAGPDTGLDNPAGVAFPQDEEDEFAIANTLGVVIAPGSGTGICAAPPAGAGFSLGTITEYFLDDAGDVIPINNSPVLELPFPPGVVVNATIGGCDTFLLGPTGIQSDGTGKLYAVNSFAGYVTSYAPGAFGNVFPSNIIGIGTLTATGGAFVAVGPATEGGNEIFVTDIGDNTIKIFDTSTFFGSLIAVIDGGRHSKIFTPMGIDMAGDDLYVANNARNSFLMFDNDEGQLEIGGAVHPDVKVKGPRTNIVLPTGLAIPHFFTGD